ncbi:FusB/FusC family EF-G-binding protein [Clostridium sp.]|uniref:FusB/FusC family EF-G-binding protein n=1 Tax=Clostridium sp. TaxID=1506 RepID=UPI002FC82BA3
MKAFIKKHEYNYIKKCLGDFNNALRNCLDTNTILASKAYIQDKILNSFTNLSEEEKALLDISNITDPLHIDKYLINLNEYVYGMPKVTNVQISKIFKKEKKLKLPDIESQEAKNVYLGWIDPSIRKLVIVYNMNGKLLGMACRIPNSNYNNTNVCALCNHIGPSNEIAFVSPVCKKNSANKDYYRSIGFHMCLDSAKCNERIVSLENLENILKDVNNIK